jgi:copper(I)-binding protein
MAAALAMAACGDDDDSDTAAGDTAGAPMIEVSDAWARTSPTMATAGAAYMEIANTGDAGDALVAVTVADTVAGRVELHESRAVTSDEGMDAPTTSGMGDMGDETSMTSPMMEMVPVERIDVPAGGTTSLEPGGYHVMLLDLAAPLENGEELELTLTFETAGDIAVTAVVADSAP